MNLLSKSICCNTAKSSYIQGFVKSRASDKLTGCEQNMAIIIFIVVNHDLMFVSTSSTRLANSKDTS